MIYIVEDIGRVVQSMRNGGGFDEYFEPQFEHGTNGAPFYMYGHRMEIADRLSQKNIDPIKKNRKYPLVALKLDIAETIIGDVHEFRLNLVIATYSDAKRNAEERMVATFKPTLYPLYEEFFTQFIASGMFMWDGDQSKPPHIKIDRPYWGTESKEANVKNIFNDPVDAIEIVDLRVRRTDKTYC
jgi:hypothetical protein